MRRLLTGRFSGITRPLSALCSSPGHSYRAPSKRQCLRKSSSPLLLLHHVYFLSRSLDLHLDVVFSPFWIARPTWNDRARHDRELIEVYPCLNKKHTRPNKDEAPLKPPKATKQHRIITDTRHLTAYSLQSDFCTSAICSAVASTLHSRYVISHPGSSLNPQFTVVEFHMVPENLSFKRFPQFDKSLAIWGTRYGDW
ncbi:hypothetical protein EK21DRAFT_84197 [Setomelanomma holmii]|uniref:Uncharacterized protein n=1 Tax=Setomelanomma holmii TaxID=210430 RepID=A0A9P4LUI5_9PLEO|nr:hypothetical protein EK21DRAFT_84197 [Setomelanomma holmii]